MWEGKIIPLLSEFLAEMPVIKYRLTREKWKFINIYFMYTWEIPGENELLKSGFRIQT